MAWTTLCNLSDLTEGLGRYLEIDGCSLAVFLVGGQVHAMDNLCPHAGGSMSGGYIDDGCAVCPWHGWAFDLHTGVLRGATGQHCSIRIYPIRFLPEQGRTLVQADLPML